MRPRRTRTARRTTGAAATAPAIAAGTAAARPATARTAAARPAAARVATIAARAARPTTIARPALGPLAALLVEAATALAAIERRRRILRHHPAGAGERHRPAALFALFARPAAARALGLDERAEPARRLRLGRAERARSRSRRDRRRRRRRAASPPPPPPPRPRSPRPPRSPPRPPPPRSSRRPPPPASGCKSTTKKCSPTLTPPRGSASPPNTRTRRTRGARSPTASTASTQPRQPIAGDADRLADLLAELLGRHAFGDELGLGLRRPAESPAPLNSVTVRNGATSSLLASLRSFLLSLEEIGERPEALRRVRRRSPGAASPASPASASPSDNRRLSASTASTTTSSASPIFTASRAWRSGRPLPSSLTCNSPSTPGATSTNAPNVSRRRTVPLRARALVEARGHVAPRVLLQRLQRQRDALAASSDRRSSRSSGSAPRPPGRRRARPSGARRAESRARRRAACPRRRRGRRRRRSP